MAVAVPLFVRWSGTVGRGRGELGATFIGGLTGVGIVGALALGAWGASSVSSTASGGMLLLTLTAAYVAPLIGAIVGYEMSHAKVLQSGGPTVVPVRIKDGGGVALAWAI